MINTNKLALKDVKELASEFLALLEKAEKVEADLKSLHKDIASMDGYIAERMMNENVDSISLEGIEIKPIDEPTFSLDKGIVGTSKWDCDAFFKFLRDIGEGDLIVQRESVHPQTRIKALKEFIEQGIELPNFVIIRPWTHLKYNKSAVKRKANG